MELDLNHNTIRFDSLAELADHNLREGTCHLPHRGATQWFDNQTMHQTARLMREGDDRCVPEARKLIEQFMGTVEIKTATLVPDVCGAFPLVPEYLAGEPECFLRVEQRPSAATPLHIAIDPTCSGGFSANDMRTRGVALLALVMALSAVRPVTLELCSTMTCSERLARHADGSLKFRGDHVSYVRTAINTAPLDLATAAYALTSVAVPRRMTYGLFEKHFCDGLSLQWADFRATTGEDRFSVTSPAVMRRYIECAGLDGDVLFIPGGIIVDKALKKNPTEWVRSMFDRYCIPAEQREALPA